jgi:Ser-tRNA(Ala) deacylase AlaX
MQSQENGRDVIILDQTIFYPQGGGQPYDQGIIENNAGKFIVEEVRFVDGIVKHIGTFKEGAFGANDKVVCIIDQKRRELHSRLHSAGHVVDMAIDSLKIEWIPGKGYHFPDGPYIEYTGDLEGINKDELKVKIESLCDQFIKEARDVKLVFMEKEQMKEVCRHVPDYLPADKPTRIVIYGDFGVPCGGTHVNNLRDIGKISIRKIDKKGSNIRIGYEVS